MADPEIIAHYAIERHEDGSLFELGRGAMGTTYKAFDTKLRCTVCLKVINSQILNNELVRQRFLREARSAAGLRHKNVASVFHLGDEGDVYFYAMEFIDGDTIHALVRRIGRFDAPTVVDIALQVVSALAAAHRRSLIHRDIKPANLMLVREEEDEILVKVIDFGLAKSLEAEGKALTVGGGFVGTVDYASPEQLDERPLDIRSDIYSLGATLWYMLAGRPVFSGSMLQVMSQHLHKPPPLEHLIDVPDTLSTLLQRMLAKDPGDRPQTPQLLRQELMACRQVLVAHVASVTGGAPGPTTATLLSAELHHQTQVPGMEASVVQPGTDAGTPMTGTVIAGRYRLDKYCGGSQTEPFFQARDLYSRYDVALKVLLPATSGGRRGEALEEAIKTVQAAPHRNLRKILSFERFTSFDTLVSEWIAGVPLIDVLTARSALTLGETLSLVEQVVDAVDHANAHQLSALDLSIHRVFIQRTDGEGVRGATTWLHQPMEQWPPFVLKIPALRLESVVENETMGDMQDRTIMADLLSASSGVDDGTGTRDPLFALGFLTYTLLGGRTFGAPDGGQENTRGPGKLSVLSETQNELLHGVLVAGNGNNPASAREFFDAFGKDVPRPRPGSAVGWDGGVSNPPVPAGPARGLDAMASVNDQSGLETQLVPVTGDPAEQSEGDSANGRRPTTASARRAGRWGLWVVAAGVLVGVVVIIGWLMVSGLRARPKPVVSLPQSSAPKAVSTPAPALGQEEQLMSMLGTGQDFEKAGNYAGAIKTYLQASKDFPGFDAPMLRLNKVLERFQDQIADDNKFKSLRASITQAAEGGSALAMMLLGTRLLKAEPAEAMHWYKLAADNGRIDAMTQLGKMCWVGQGLKNGPEPGQAASWFDKASDGGDAEGKFLLAQCYRDGRGVSRDLTKAVELLRAAATLSYPAALNQLGEMYRDGTGVPTSYKQASDYFEQAHQAGNADAAANLGVIYINGQDVPKNPRYGLNLVRQGAEENSPLAMYYYAFCFEKGIGQSANLEQAKLWYGKAAHLGNAKAVEWCDKNNVSY